MSDDKKPGLNEYENLLHVVGLAKQAYYRKPGFNLFSVLRSESDEVRLHSRFLGVLLKPDIYGSRGEEAIKLFFEHMGIKTRDGDDCFSLSGLKVYLERDNIDILIINDDKQAFFIENKIYADDQDKQMVRYYESLKRGGRQKIFARYLTLDGSKPSDGSLGHLKDEWPNDLNFECISYSRHILNWLREIVGIAAADAPLRESIFQYIGLIEKLTGKDQGDKYMEQLIKELLSGNNMELAFDIKAAYENCLIRLQAEFWKNIDLEAKKYTDMYAHLDRVNNYFLKDEKSILKVCEENNGRNSWVYFRIPGFDHVDSAKIGIGIYNSFFYGVRHGREDKKILDILNGKFSKRPSNDQAWVAYWWLGGDLNFRDLKRDSMKLLTKTKIEDMAKDCVNKTHELWELIHNELKKTA